MSSRALMGSSAAILLLAAGTACRNTNEGRTAPVEVKLNGSGDSITVVATNVSRSAVLEELHARYGIEVRSDAPDEQISPRIAAAPLVDGIRQLLPPGTRFGLRVGERDRYIGLVPQTGDKTGSPEIRADTLPVKGRTRAFAPGPDARLKGPAERPYEPSHRNGPRLKPAPDSTLSIAGGKGPKLEQPAQEADSSIRLTFVIISPDSVRLVGAQLAAGAAPISRNVEGPFLFVVRAGGQVVHFGALLDPLEQHSYLEDGTHDVGRAHDGSFGIWLPPPIVNRLGPGGVTFEFYDARAVTLPPELDEATLKRAVSRARPVARLEWPSLRTLLEERRPQ